MGKVIPARIDGIVAREAPVAVIFRRGPSRHTQLLTWNLETDEITPGQWITGQVNTRSCDLSPNGKLLLGAFANYTKRHQKRFNRGSEVPEGWSAVSRPPFFTAIAVWCGPAPWFTGGLWTGNQGVILPMLGTQVIMEPPEWLRTTTFTSGLSEEIVFRVRLGNYGWKVIEARGIEDVFIDPERVNKLLLDDDDESGASQMITMAQEIGKILEQRAAQLIVMEKPFTRGTLRRIETGYETWQVVDCEGVVRRQFLSGWYSTQFLDIDHRGRVVFGDQGCLWAWEGFPDGKPTLIADLNANRFEAIEAPAWAVSREKP